MTIIVCYKPPNNTLAQEEWDSLIANVKMQKPCIILGDFNAHNASWNYSNTSIDETRLYSSILENEVFKHNTDTITHIDFSHQSYSNIDLICSTNDIAHNITYKVHDELLGFDHFLIYITYNIEKELYHKKASK